MNENGYRLLALVVWRGAKWYAKKRGLSTLAATTMGVGGVVLAGGAAVLVHRSRRTAEQRQLGPGPKPY